MPFSGAESNVVVVKDLTRKEDIFVRHAVAVSLFNNKGAFFLSSLLTLHSSPAQLPALTPRSYRLRAPLPSFLRFSEYRDAQTGKPLFDLGFSWDAMVGRIKLKGKDQKGNLLLQATSQFRGSSPAFDPLLLWDRWLTSLSVGFQHKSQEREDGCQV